MSFRILNVVLVVAVTACVDDPRNQRPQEVTWSQSLQRSMDVVPPKKTGVYGSAVACEQRTR